MTAQAFSTTKDPPLHKSLLIERCGGAAALLPLPEIILAGAFQLQGYVEADVLPFWVYRFLLSLKGARRYVQRSPVFEAAQSAL